MHVAAREELDTRQLLAALNAFRRGDFSARLPDDWLGLAGKIADAFNQTIETSERMAAELDRVSRAVGKDGKVIDPGAPAAPNAEPTPQNGVRSRGEEREGVFVVDKGKAVFRAVKTGIMGENDIEILEGIKEGDEIVTGPYKSLRTLRNDARIKVSRPAEKK